MSRETEDEIASWSLDCLTTVAALGYGVPTAAFLRAFNLLQPQGWVAFNIKETFLDRSDSTGFSQAIRELIFSEYLDLHHLERYRHRLSIQGEPLYYYGVAGRKTAHIPREMFELFGVSVEAEADTAAGAKPEPAPVLAANGGP
jgi:hypothetical protein